MSTLDLFVNRRVLVVDDNVSIHEDVRKVLAAAPEASEIDRLRAELFDVEEEARDPGFEISSASQGREALVLVEKSIADGRPFSVAFVDMRMPPGWDGLETIERMWAVDPELQMVICTAYSDHGSNEIARRLGNRDGLVLKKPFDVVEVRQMAQTLSRKWSLHQYHQQKLASLDVLVRQRTQEADAANAKLLQEIDERHRMEAELRLSQKLEAVGQLAAGIAHEINTPIQYVGDSVHFLHRASNDASQLLAIYRALLPGDPATLAAVAKANEEADVEFLTEEVPKAFARVFDGIQRVATIVRAMKDFAHPQDYGEKTPADLNHAITSTATVARNEYKYLADLALELSDIPPVPCFVSDLNQVFLNLLINAAHAIGDANKGSERRGLITVRTRADEADVVVEVSDTGCGIPEHVRPRIFDPFFTTKEVGRGTGQGLAISRSIVVEKHGGKLSFETEVGKGTTFVVRLPKQQAVVE